MLAWSDLRRGREYSSLFDNCFDTSLLKPISGTSRGKKKCELWPLLSDSTGPGRWSSAPEGPEGRSKDGSALRKTSPRSLEPSKQPQQDKGRQTWFKVKNLNSAIRDVGLDPDCSSPECDVRLVSFFIIGEELFYSVALVSAIQ